MKFSYQMTRENLKSYMIGMYNIANIFYLCIFTISYFFFTFNLLMYSFIIVLIFYFIGTILLYFILNFINNIIINNLLNKNDKITNNAYGNFDCEINNQGIIEKNDINKFQINWNNVKRIKINKKSIVIIPKNSNISFLFIKKLFANEILYNEVVLNIKKYSNR